MRDVMFYLEAQNKVGQSPLKDEIQQGEVVIATPNGTPNTSGQTGAVAKGAHRRKKSGR